MTDEKNKVPAAPAPAPAKKESKKSKKKPPYYVADGKAVTCLKGTMLAEGDEVKAEYFPGGMDRVKELIELGVVAEG
ncbi:MAG: hypothetical protein K0U20_09045 [Proteobacteria bacterium]|nr:hypothetical protein [Pseudomonadota bacterium]